MTVRTDFEPEDIEPPRRHGRVAVLVALCVAAASAGGLWAAWRIASHHGANADVPIIRADEQPVKVPPTNPGGMTVPDQDLYVLNHQRPADSKVEQLLPPPETPLPRPAPPPAAVAAPAAAPEMPAAAPVAAPAVAPAASVRAPVAAPAAEPAAVMPVAPPLTFAAAATGYRLQVAAVRSPEMAQKEWARLKHAQADILGRLGVRTVRVDLRGRGIFYRVEAGPIADAAAAQKDCDTLKQRKVGCLLVKP